MIDLAHCRKWYWLTLWGFLVCQKVRKTTLRMMIRRISMIENVAKYYTNFCMRNVRTAYYLKYVLVTTSRRYTWKCMKLHSSFYVNRLVCFLQEAGSSAASWSLRSGMRTETSACTFWTSKISVQRVRMKRLVQQRLLTILWVDVSQNCISFLCLLACCTEWKKLCFPRTEVERENLSLENIDFFGVVERCCAFSPGESETKKS